jgi:hypothetical protein
MVRVLGSALDGRDGPLLAQYPARLEPALDRLVGRIEQLPEPAVQAIYPRAGWADAITAGRLEQVRSERLAGWVVRHYPRRRYPVVFIGSSNGAMVHLAAALGAPWLPQTLLLAVRYGGLDPDDPAADMQAMASAGRALVEGRWPITTVGDRHVFQFGALGGATEREFGEGGPRVARFLRQQGSDRAGW